MLTTNVSLKLSEDYTRDENKDVPIGSFLQLKVILG
jgi:hypothetical protein